MRGNLLSPMDIKRRLMKARRPVAKTVKVGRYPAARVGSNMGNVRKGKKPKPRAPGTVFAHYDQNLYTQQKQVAYVGFWTAGNTDQLLDCYAGAIMRQIFTKCGFPPQTWQGLYKPFQDKDSSAITLGVQEIQFLFSRELGRPVAGAAGTDYHTYVMTVTATNSFTDYVEALRDQLIGRYDDGFLPACWEAFLSTDSQRRLVASNPNWGEEMVHFDATSTIKIQNVTPASNLVGDGRTDTSIFNVNDIAANPLQGKVYDFANDVPKLVSAFAENYEATTTSYTNIADIQTKSRNQLFMDTKTLRSDSGWNGALLKSMSQPFSGPQVFRNVAGTTRVGMPPGGYKSFLRKAHLVANTRRFVRSVFAYDSSTPTSEGGVLFAPNYPQKSMFNKAIMVGLEPALRTASGDSEFVNLAANQDIRMKVSLKRAPTKALPTHINVANRVEQFA